jgi:hypothetical protein
MTVLQALGFGIALVFHSLYPLMGPSRLVYYHSSTTMHSVVLACVFDLLLGAAVYLLLRTVLSRTGGWRAAQFGIAVLLPWMLLVLDPSLLISAWAHVRARLAATQLPAGYGSGTMPMHTRYLVLAVWCVFLLMLLRFVPHVYKKLMTVGAIGLAALGVFTFLGSYSLVKAWQWRPGSGASLPVHSRGAMTAHARIVWVVLDELSYEQTFDRRPPDLALPNFDALAAESNVYSNVRPIGYWTEMVIPSLLLGSKVNAIRASGSTQMLMGDATGKFSRYPAQQTLTADAQRLGWNVGIVGWYNPYCSILAGTFQSCFWTDRENPSGPMLTAATVGKNMLAGVTDNLSFGRPDLGVDLARSEDELLFAHADGLLRDDQMDFLFLHFPLPHPPGVWNRRKNAWASSSGPHYVASYEDNLVLADRELGHILELLKRSPRWPQTSVFVQGDHGWRVAMWHGHPSWTPEDESNSRGGIFDDRPALIVHAAGQAEGERISTPTSLMRAHDMIQATLQTGTPFTP